MSNYRGVIIEESLGDKSLLSDLKIVSTKVEPIAEEQQTPWLKQWTLHTVKISEDQADSVAEKISQSFDKEHPDWYADYKNNRYHYVIFNDKVFKVDMAKPEEYKSVVGYGLSLGIPDYQLDFTPEIKQWER